MFTDRCFMLLCEIRVNNYILSWLSVTVLSKPSLTAGYRHPPLNLKSLFFSVKNTICPSQSVTNTVDIVMMYCLSELSSFHIIQDGQVVTLIFLILSSGWKMMMYHLVVPVFALYQYIMKVSCVFTDGFSKFRPGAASSGFLNI